MSISRRNFDEISEADADKKELLKDMSSFANTSGGHILIGGGHILIGMDTDDGVPVEIAAINQSQTLEYTQPILISQPSHRQHCPVRLRTSTRVRISVLPRSGIPLKIRARSVPSGSYVADNW